MVGRAPGERQVGGRSIRGAECRVVEWEVCMDLRRRRAGRTVIWHEEQHLVTRRMMKGGEGISETILNK